MVKKILFVGGSFDNEGGRPSSLVKKVYDSIIKNPDREVELFNGGFFNELENIIQKSTTADAVIWWANVPNDLPKIRNVKEINYKTMLVNSKRNDDNKYKIFEIQQRNFAEKANLCVIFAKTDGKYKMTLIDPLSNCFYDGFDIDEMTDKMLTRLDFLKSITRQSTTTAEENNGALAYYFNQFKQEMTKVDEEFKKEVEDKREFIDLVRTYADQFAFTVTHSTDVKRFLGNSAFRCIKGLPSFRDKEYIFVTRRNVDKMYIDINAFIPTFLGEDGKLYYYGDYKPSVDSPIQVRLYKAFPNINYIIHAHCYVKGGVFTNKVLPCGALEEVDEILSHIEDRNKKFYAINLKGHGMLIMGNTVDDLKGMEFYSRPELEMN